MDRRRFLHLGVGGLASAAVTGCGPLVELPPVMAPTYGAPDVAGDLPGLVSSSAPDETAAGTMLRNENVPGFFVRYYQPFPAPDLAKWQLDIHGLVDAPVRLSLEEVLSLFAYREQSTRMKCVEGWSVRAAWGGFTYAALAQLVKPHRTATHIYFSCEDDYWEVLSLDDLRRAGALFVTHLDGIPLTPSHGAPLRMIVPWLYGYKAPKAITALSFTDFGGPGYWSTEGRRYPPDGAIRPGADFPIDLGGDPRQVDGGRITAY